MNPALPRPIALEGASDARSERGMRISLSIVIAFFVVQDVFDLSLSLGPGLSAKNAILYVLAATLAFKMTLQRSYAFDLRALHVCFAILIAYSMISMLFAAFVIEYPRYKLISSGIRLKTLWIDRAVFFLVFFYGLRKSVNAQSVLTVLLVAVALSNSIALLNALDIAQIGTMGQNHTGRVQGLMGEPNQDAAFGALFLPAVYAGVMAARGVGRLPWLAALLVTFGAILVTVSRGGFLAVLASSLWAAIVFRRHVPMQRIIAVAVGALTVIALAALVVVPTYGPVLYTRVFMESSTGDMTAVSSGRTQIWSTALSTMADQPITLFTGFGWNVYPLMPFRYAPHNYYLDLWFNLGLVGLICGTMLLVLVVRQALAAVPAAAAPYRSTLMAFSVGAVAIAIATFFVDLYTPWLWFWAYAGLVMRIAVNEYRMAQVKAQAEQSARRTSKRADPYGWVASRALT